MKKSLLFVLILFLTLGAAFAKNPTLQDLYSTPEMKAELDAVMKQLDEADTTMTHSYKIKGNTMTYIYKFTSQIEDTSSICEVFDMLFTDKLVDTIKDGIKEESGIKDVHIQYIYYNKDGSEIYNHTW